MNAQPCAWGCWEKICRGRSEGDADCAARCIPHSGKYEALPITRGKHSRQVLRREESPKVGAVTVCVQRRKGEWEEGREGRRANAPPSSKAPQKDLAAAPGPKFSRCQCTGCNVQVGPRKKTAPILHLMAQQGCP